MLLLASTSDLLRVVTSAAANIKSRFDYVDYSSPSTVTPGRSNEAAITTATTTTVVDSPGSGVIRNIKSGWFKNAHASNDCDVTPEHTDGTNVVPGPTATLAPGEMLALGEDGLWHHYDANGSIIPGTAGAGGSLAAATQTEMEAASSNAHAVTPAVAHFAPSAAKLWVNWTGNSTTILASYNVTSITDTGTGDAEVTIDVDFSSVNWVPATNGINAGAWTTAIIASTGLDAKTAGTASVRHGTMQDGGTAAGGVADPEEYSLVGFGDQ